MANNKVIYGNTTIMDITDTTAEASDVAAGKVFYGNDGVRTVGTGASGNYMELVSNPTANDILVTDANGQAVDSGVQLSAKQDTLVSGTNIKTVNGNSLLGSGSVETLDVYEAATIDDVGAYIYGNGESIELLKTTDGLDFIFTDSNATALDVDLAEKSYVDNAIPTIDQTYDGTSTNAQSGVAIQTQVDNLQTQIDGLGEPFRLQDFTQQINLTIPHCNQDIANTSIPNVDIDLDIIDPTGQLNQNFAIAGLAKYEVYDATSGGNRINCWPVCSFSMNGQRVLRIRMMCAGSTGKTARRIAGALLLKHR